MPGFVCDVLPASGVVIFLEAGCGFREAKRGRRGALACERQLRKMIRVTQKKHGCLVSESGSRFGQMADEGRIFFLLCEVVGTFLSARASEGMATFVRRI